MAPDAETFRQALAVLDDDLVRDIWTRLSEEGQQRDLA
jgi:hypothetical protein